MTDMRIWLQDLASDKPAPGGGGAAALTGACAAALGAMVANLTAGNKKYAEVSEEMKALALKTYETSEHMFTLIDLDREAFLPLAEAYRIPKDDPCRPEKMESALRVAAGVPMEMLRTAGTMPELLRELLEKGTRLALSDVGCAAELCSACASSAHMNVLVNTGLMKDRAFAAELDGEAGRILSETKEECEKLYAAVRAALEKK